MDKLETNALSSKLLISPYKRYVDDIYLLTTNEEIADQFHHAIYTSSWKTTPKGLSLSLLDFKVTISQDGKSQKLIRNEWKRIEDRCFTEILTTKDQKTFDDFLCLNGYPENSINQIKRPKNQRDSRIINTEISQDSVHFWLTKPQTTNIFRRESPVRNAYRSHTLRRALSHNTAECSCTISHTNLCLW